MSHEDFGQVLKSMNDPWMANEAKIAVMPDNHPLKNLGQRVADGLNRAVMEEHARDVAEYQAIKARGETPPQWLTRLVENAGE